MFETRNRALALTVARRTVSTLITLLGVAIIVFVILRLLPGDAITASLGVNAGLLSPAQHAALVHFYGLGKPPVQQFFSWLGATFSGNLGVSLSAQQPVSTLIRPGGAGDARAVARLARARPADRRRLRHDRCAQARQGR